MYTVQSNFVMQIFPFCSCIDNVNVLEIDACLIEERRRKAETCEKYIAIKTVKPDVSEGQTDKEKGFLTY